MDALEILRAARDRVAKNWIQGDLKDGHGGYCAIGAIHLDPSIREEYVCDDNSGPCTLLAKAAGIDSIWGIADWNDDPYRTQLQVIAAFDKAISLAEGRTEVPVQGSP